MKHITRSYDETVIPSVPHITGSYDETLIPSVPQTIQKFKGKSQVQPGYIQHPVLLWVNNAFHSHISIKLGTSILQCTASILWWHRA